MHRLSFTCVRPPQRQYSYDIDDTLMEKDNAEHEQTTTVDISNINRDDVKPSNSRTAGDNDDDGDDGWVCVGHQSTFGTRTALKVHGRQVTVLRLRRRQRGASSSSLPSSSSSSSSTSWVWTCVDSICYHAGGPLMQGKLMSVGSRTCVSCPWHAYLVDIFTGEGLYMDMSRKYCSKGVRQRVHQVKVDATSEHVYVRLSATGKEQNDEQDQGQGQGQGQGDTKIQSDEYAYIGRNFAHGSEVPTKSFPEW